MFDAELTQIDGEKLNLKNKEETDQVVADLTAQELTVKAVKRSERKRRAPAPFTTSSLQQDAARKLGFVSRRTMRIAQQLYEGIELGHHGATGLITYMRTDSTRISELAQGEARTFLENSLGAAYVPEKPNIYAAGKKAQDAHEAIRPTNIELTPASLEKYLDKDQMKLYTLIWQRFAASQMTPAIYDTMGVTIQAGTRYTIRTNGSKLKFPGFTAVYAGADSKKKEKDVVLPDMEEGDALQIAKTLPEQHFTEPPPRYNDASLVKTLEEKEIGRPSTYAPIIDTIQARGYVQRIDKHFQPTELGFVVIDMLEKYFKNIVNVKFTADLENELDEVEMPVEVANVRCEKCGRMMVVKQGRYGKFLACPGFPECRNTKPLLVDTGVKCPKCGGAIVERKTHRGRKFYGCENYPKCDYTTWDAPQKETCKECGSFMLLHRFKNGRTMLYCSNDDCKSRINHPMNQELEKIRARMEAKKKRDAEKAAEEAQKEETEEKEKKA